MTSSSRPPGKYDLTYSELVEVGGVPNIPKRPFIKKIRRDDPLSYTGDFSMVIMYMVYPWVLYDERDGEPVSAFKTQEAAFRQAVKMMTAIPDPINFKRLRSTSFEELARFLKKYGV